MGTALAFFLFYEGSNLFFAYLDGLKYSPTLRVLDIRILFGLESFNASYYVIWISCVGCKHKLQKMVTMLHNDIGTG